jgi:dTDP-4-amino-4,6-dideoxygalactose transaminase
MHMSEQLAINGGIPVRNTAFPSYADASGRWLGDEEKRLLMEVIDSGSLNRNGGTKVEFLEKQWGDMLGVTYAQAVTSGTAALHTAVAALNLEPGDEVITTTITDMGTLIGILANNLVPTFADIDPRTGNVTAATIAREITAKTRAIIVVHLFGQPADLDPILALAREHNLKVVEDCAQAHLATYKGRYVGTIGDIGCFSFQQSKQMTTGDGGMVVTNNEQLGVRARLFADKAWPRGLPNFNRSHLFLGMNYRMTELQGAVGVAQTGKLPAIVARRRQTTGLLTKLISGVPGIKPPYLIDGVESAWWTYTFMIDQKVLGVTPQTFAAATKAEGLPFGVGYIPNPVFEYDVIRERKTFGSSGIPWTLPQARQGITYDRKDYPSTMTFIDEMFVTNWNEGMSEADVRDIAAGLSKVATYYAGKK